MVLDQKIQEVLLECRYVYEEFAIVQVYPGNLTLVVISPSRVVSVVPRSNVLLESPRIL
jgi:hypothetical protein